MEPSRGIRPDFNFSVRIQPRLLGRVGGIPAYNVHAHPRTRATGSYHARHAQRPAYRFRIGRQQTLVYVDNGEKLDGTRLNRWLYQGLHSLDLPLLYKCRPAWDILVLALLMGGTALCVTSMILSWRVVARKLVRIFPSPRIRTTENSPPTTRTLGLRLPWQRSSGPGYRN
jgi:hypothetical protein